MSSRKRKRSDPPDKGNKWEEETINYEDSYESNSWNEERRLADEIVKSMRRNNNNVFKLDRLTRGRGNCYHVATLQQLNRDEVYERARPEVKEIAESMDHRKLRKGVKNWIEKHSDHPKVVGMKKLYDLDQIVKRDKGEETKTWQEYWDHMLKDGIWADSWFIQATAWFLKLHLWIMDTRCTADEPYFTIEGNLEEDDLCYEVLYLGLVHETHYQSLLIKENGDEDMIKDSFDTHEVNEDHEQKNMEESWPEGKSELSNEVYNVFDDVVKQENPWDITSIFDLAYFCCPECDLRIQDKQEFVTHAATCHPWVRYLCLFILFCLNGRLPEGRKLVSH